ncbi:amidohydrolase family protein [Pyrenophora tritici-repentis]|nr:amidohydrolase family protein [Pyrenophora tritici-repentis]KAI1601218.1 amidohydrolase family protein [Pyrenophora tritici-repentis]PWO21002.1 WD40 repeat containing protein [Pyrenophora tritici-repentis]PZD44927.1 amidohydrolase family protein [Pyrenophora tritici-repentis]
MLRASSCLSLLALTSLISLIDAATLFAGGTVIAWDQSAQRLDILRNGSVLVEDDSITTVFSGSYNGTLPHDLDVVDATNDIISTGFIDTHRHSWQTAFKTLGSNTTLMRYFERYGTSSPASRLFTPEDVYIGQLVGMLEALNGGVTTIVDFPHCAWSAAHSKAALDATFESGVRTEWAYNFGSYTNFTFDAQVELFQDLVADQRFSNSSTRLGISYDGFNTAEQNQTRKILDLARESNVSVVTTHANGGVYGAKNFPSLLHNTFSFLNQSIPIIFAHASYHTPTDAQLLRQHNHYISTTPESEMHYGHLHPNSHLILDQSALGIDTHFTFSSDVLTQARLWLQSIRKIFYREVIDRRELPAENPMSATQAFLLATRNGALALRRSDIGVLCAGAKADLLVWNGRAPSLLGWTDPVAAVVLHANVGDIKHVMVGGEFRKKDGVLTVDGYERLQDRFLESARRIQGIWREMELPVTLGEAQNGVQFETPMRADVEQGEGDGYGELFI